MDDEEKQRKPLLKIVSVEFVPSPDGKTRLARVYDLLLGENDRNSHPEEAEQDINTTPEMAVNIWNASRGSYIRV